MDASECAHQLSVTRRCLIVHLPFEAQLATVDGSVERAKQRVETSQKAWGAIAKEADALEINCDR
eukprot:2669522-Pyramimonas_sp.AAC.1